MVRAAGRSDGLAGCTGLIAASDGICEELSGIPALEAVRKPRCQVLRMAGGQRSRSYRSKVGTGLISLVFSASSAHAETRSYVMSLFAPAMYTYEGDCNAIEP